MLFLYAIPMTVADVLGNLTGSQLAIRTGPTIVRRFLLLSLVILFVSLIWKYYFTGQEEGGKRDLEGRRRERSSFHSDAAKKDGR